MNKVDITWHIKMSEDEEKSITEAMKDFGISHNDEFINSSISLLFYVLKELKEGRIISSIDEEKKTYREIHMPIFDNVKKTNDQNH